MITLSLNFDKATNKANRGSHEKQIRDIIDTHLTFPGSDKLKWGVTVRDNGAASVSFTGPQEAVDEAKRLWRENVKPAAEKVKRAATKIKRTATRNVKLVATRATKSTKKLVKAVKSKSRTKPTRSRAKTKMSKRTTNRR